MTPESKPQDRPIFPDPMMEGCAEVVAGGCLEVGGGCIGGLAALPLALLSVFWSS